MCSPDANDAKVEVAVLDKLCKAAAVQQEQQEQQLLIRCCGGCVMLLAWL